MISHEDLLKHLIYNPETGVFRWKRPTCKRLRVGQIAGCIDHEGYWLVRINGKNYRAGRLAWFYIYGEWPKFEIDHINRDRCDDRIDNLREATTAQNHANAKLHRRNTSGVKGVRYNGYSWVAQIGHSHIGSYETQVEAAEAYRKTAKEMYGEFAGPTTKEN
jgi:hypothetical protein